jgi:hypothetical protein
LGFALERLLNPIVEVESRAEEHILRCRVDVRDEGSKSAPPERGEKPANKGCEATGREANFSM